MHAAIPENWTTGPLMFDGLEVGPTALRTLARDGIGRVVAVFRRCFYVEICGAMVCVGPRDFPGGALNVRPSAPEAIDWRASSVTAGQRTRLTRSTLRVGHWVVVHLGSARPWVPNRTSAPIDRALLRRGLTTFEKVSEGWVPEAGLGRFLGQAHGSTGSDPLHRRAEGPIRDLGIWCRSALRDSRHPYPDTAARLIGLGPGLTPSGDDFLAGVMIVLRSLEQDRAAQKLWTGVRRSLTTTNQISQAHLSAAAEGLGHAALHDAIAAILDGDVHAMDAAVAGIDTIGETSGWDAMAGVLLVLRAYSDTFLEGG